MKLTRRDFSRLAGTGLLAAAAPRLFAPALAQNKPLRIGIIAPRSGAAGTAGECGIRAVQWATERMNKDGGIAGRKFELVIEEETNPKDTIERLRRLILQEKVDAIHGLISTGVSLGVAPVAEEEQALVHLCGLVHDIGKIGLPAGLLEKPGALTLEERRQMEEHSSIGEKILSKVDDYAEIARIVRHHHERVDGVGYPDGLSGEEIPLAARIISVADAYNAMTSDRPYRDAMPSRVARLRLAQAVESQFDTAVVAAFEAVLAGGTEAYRSGEREDFSLEVRVAEGTLQVAVS